MIQSFLFFLESRILHYAAKLAVDNLKENISPNFDFEQKMAPSIPPTVFEKKPAPCAQIPSSVSAWAPFVMSTSRLSYERLRH
jgi:hypothetical protein